RSLHNRKARVERLYPYAQRRRGRPLRARERRHQGRRAAGPFNTFEDLCRERSINARTNCRFQYRPRTRPLLRSDWSNVMNSSLWSADLTTHVKIVAVSLIARISDADTTGVRTNVDAPVVVKAGKPLVFTTNDTSATR